MNETTTENHPPPGPLDQVYQDEVAPLLERIREVAREHTLPFFFCMATDLEVGDEGWSARRHLACDTGMTQEEAEAAVDSGKTSDFARALLAARIAGHMRVEEEGWVPVRPEDASRVMQEWADGEDDA